MHVSTRIQAAPDWTVGMARPMNLAGNRGQDLKVNSPFGYIRRGFTTPATHIPPTQCSTSSLSTSSSALPSTSNTSSSMAVSISANPTPSSSSSRSLPRPRAASPPLSTQVPPPPHPTPRLHHHRHHPSSTRRRMRKSPCVRRTARPTTMPRSNNPRPLLSLMPMHLRAG